MAEIKYLDRTISPRVEKIFQEIEEKALERRKQSIENLYAEQRRMVIESNKRLEETYKKKMKEIQE